LLRYAAARAGSFLRVGQRAARLQTKIERRQCMFKRVLGVALLGVGIASTAHASSVTLYGVVDIGIEGAKKSDQSSTLGMGSGIQAGSRWGIRGSEDLGGSLKANFMLETGITVNDGNVQN